MNEQTIIQGMHLGDRGTSFKRLIQSLLKKSDIKDKYISILTDDKGMEEYASAFTSSLVDEVNNYEVYEQLGDLTGNKFIVWYIYRRFPQLKCSKGVKVAARIRINYGSKQTFFKIAEDIGFWPFISAPNDLRQRKMKSLLEDVFEAFLGVTETLIDNKIREGVGYAIVYEILKNIFDKMDISMDYNKLYDAKTRLKELFDMKENELGPLVYRDTLNRENGITTSIVYRVENGKYHENPDGTINRKKIVGGYYRPIGEGSSALKSDAQQKAAEQALENLEKLGHNKPIANIYKTFEKGEKPDESSREINTSYLVSKWGENGRLDINALVPTRGKCKYQTKYLGTLLGMFIKQGNLSGIKTALEMGGNPNVKDNEGMSSFDLLEIRRNDEKKKEIIEILNRTFAK